MEVICPKEKCTGCSACMNVCPKEAITMVELEPLGHIHPLIDSSKCIDCHLCEKTCPVNYPVSFHKPLNAYAAVSRDYDDLMSSSSGGAASVFSHVILEHGGVVYGCVQENYKNISHTRISRKEDLHKLKGSKYVQSNINLAYRNVRQDLKSEKLVLFIGTPCQVAGLRSFLKKEYHNLFTIDLVCHGVPSQKLLREEVLYMLGNDCDAYVHFRRKGEPLARMFGLFLSNCSKVDENKELFLYNDYITAFMNGLTFRKSCYSCSYAQGSRCSDITVSDYWGIGKSTLKTDCGISLILQNSSKASLLMDMSANYFHIEKRTVEEAIAGNGQLIAAFSEPAYRDTFIADYETIGRRAFKKHLRAYKKNWKRLYLSKRTLFSALRSRLKRIPFVYNVYKKLKRK